MAASDQGAYLPSSAFSRSLIEPDLRSPETSITISKGLNAENTIHTSKGGDGFERRHFDTPSQAFPLMTWTRGAGGDALLLIGLSGDTRPGLGC
jgi:hypothetical protein